MRFSRLTGPALSAAILLLSGACRKRAVLDPLVIPPPTAEAISFLGDTLWSVPLDGETTRSRLARLQQARQRLASRPSDVNARLSVARRTAGMGRLRESLGLLNDAIDRHIDEPRLYRLRGEVLLLTRRLSEAIEDLQYAARLTIGDTTAMEFLEIDDVGILGFGLRQSVLLALGQAYYLRGDNRSALLVLQDALAAAKNADEAAGASVWLALAQTRRADGGRREAAAVAQAWRRDAAVVLRGPEHRLLLAWKGELPLDSLRESVRLSRDPDEEALYAYALGMVQLAVADTAQARAWFAMVRNLGNWTALPYLAAEVELRRIRDASRPRSPGT